MASPFELPSEGKVTKLGLYLARRFYFRLMNWVIKYHPNAKTVCEIGPGRGHVFHWARERELKYTAIDQINASQQEGMDKFIVARVPPLPHVAADIYVFFALLEHMDGVKEALELTKSVYANLTKGGVVAILVPDIRFDGRFFWEFSDEHNFVTSMQRVSTLLEKCGFTVIRKEMLVSGIRLPLGYLIALPARALRWLYVFFKPCTALTAGHKISMKTPRAFLIGRKD